MRQTESNWELLIINDGSLDNSMEVCDFYAKSDSRIKFYNQSNLGVAKTRNEAIEKCSGEYITFLDQDDYLDSDFIEHFSSYAHNAINNKLPDVVAGGFRRPNEIGKITFQQKNHNTKFAKLNMEAAWGKMYNKQFLIDNKIEFFEGGVGEDLVFSVKAFFSTKHYISSKYIGYNWVRNMQSVSQTKQTNAANIDIINLLNALLKVGDNSKVFQYYLIKVITVYYFFSRKSQRSARKNYINKTTKWLDKNIKLWRVNPYVIFIPFFEEFRTSIKVKVFAWFIK